VKLDNFRKKRVGDTNPVATFKTKKWSVARAQTEGAPGTTALGGHRAAQEIQPALDRFFQPRFVKVGRQSLGDLGEPGKFHMKARPVFSGAKLTECKSRDSFANLRTTNATSQPQARTMRCQSASRLVRSAQGCSKVAALRPFTQFGLHQLGPSTPMDRTHLHRFEAGPVLHLGQSTCCNRKPTQVVRSRASGQFFFWNSPLLSQVSL
jgi:hypothetical protein